MTDRQVTSNSKLSFQRRVLDWMMETFSMEVTRDTTERNHRYLEESLELVQAMGCTQSEAHQLVGYVYGRPVGEPQQEAGGALVTLAALCSAADFDLAECGDRELARCWQSIDRIRAKQASKPKHSPLPGPAHETLCVGAAERPAMDIRTEPGNTVEYAFPNNGYPFDQQRLKELGLKVGDLKTVDLIDVHESSSTLYLVEHPGVAFNTVNFANAQKAKV